MESSSSSLALSFFFSFTRRFHHSSSSLPPHGSLPEKEADWLWHPIRKTRHRNLSHQVFHKSVYLFLHFFSFCCATVPPPRGRAGLRFRPRKRNEFLARALAKNKNKNRRQTKKQRTYAGLASTRTQTTNRSFVAPALSHQFKHMSAHAARGGQMESQRGPLAFHTPET